MSKYTKMQNQSNKIQSNEIPVLNETWVVYYLAGGWKNWNKYSKNSVEKSIKKYKTISNVKELWELLADLLPVIPEMKGNIFLFKDTSFPLLEHKSNEHGYRVKFLNQQFKHNQEILIQFFQEMILYMVGQPDELSDQINGIELDCDEIRGRSFFSCQLWIKGSNESVKDQKPAKTLSQYLPANSLNQEQAQILGRLLTIKIE